MKAEDIAVTAEMLEAGQAAYRVMGKDILEPVSLVGLLAIYRAMRALEPILPRSNSDA